MAQIWSDYGGWSAEEEALLYTRFGEDATLDIVERSSVDPTIVIAWIAWDRQHPDVMLLDFKERTKYDTIGGEYWPTTEVVKASEKWGAFFPPKPETAADEE